VSQQQAPNIFPTNHYFAQLRERSRGLRKIPMRKLLSVKTIALLLLLLGFGGIIPRLAVAQTDSRLDVGVDYNYAHSNLPVGGCGCFDLNGGSGWVGLNLSHSIGVVGEIASQHASNISGSGSDLTLTSFLAGPRYRRTLGRRLSPFVQVLLGGAHAGGTLAPGSSGIAGSSSAFAMITGGGLDIGLNRRIALRAFEADYYLTRFDNGVNDHQNNLRIAFGVTLRFGGRK
jgi:outer membrane immunogenic protein